MEYVEGQDLRKVLNAMGKLPVPEALAILTQILDALSAAHAMGILHRDLKPENILLTPDGRVKVADFGLGKVQAQVAQSLILSGSLVSSEGKSVSGTFEYMSPEQRRGEPPDPRDDLYAFGLLGCELLTGSRPIGAGVGRMLEREAIGEPYQSVLEKALDTRQYRYGSVRELRQGLLHPRLTAQQGSGIPARGIGPTSRREPGGLAAGPHRGRNQKVEMPALPEGGQGPPDVRTTSPRFKMEAPEIAASKGPSLDRGRSAPGPPLGTRPQKNRKLKETLSALLFLILGLFLTCKIGYDLIEQTLFEAEAESAIGKITGAYTFQKQTGKSSRQYCAISYTFGRGYSGRADIPTDRSWGLGSGGELRVLYLPRDPRVNRPVVALYRPAVWEWIIFTIIGPGIVAISAWFFIAAHKKHGYPE